MAQGTDPSVVGEVEGWAEHVQLALELIKQHPLGILVLAAIAFGVWQSLRIKELYKDNRTLTREMYSARSSGHDWGDEAEQTIVRYDRRKGRTKTSHKRREGE